MSRETIETNPLSQSFEKAKSLFDEGRFNEALGEFSSLTALDPQNAEYLAWAARTHSVKGNPSESLDLANKAIALNENTALAYYVRGWSYLDTERPTEAVKDFSKNIEMEPEDHWGFRMRAQAYRKIGNCKLAAVDIAQANGMSRERLVTKNNPFHTVEIHFSEVLSPILETNSERLIDISNAVLYWGIREKKTLSGGYEFPYLYGTCGTGYLCITDKNIYVVSLGKLTGEMPPIEKRKPPLLLQLFLPLGHDEREIEKSDRMWTIPHSAVTDVNLVKPTGFKEEGIRFVKLTTTIEAWEIGAGDPELLLTQIILAIKGELFETPEEQRPTTQSAEEIFRSIEKLIYLNYSGAISDEEFENKKRELLARL